MPRGPGSAGDHHHVGGHHMKDAIGRDIPEGSEVLFLLQTGSQPSSKDLRPGKVLRVAEGWVEVEYTSKGGLAGKSKRFSNVVLITPEMRGYAKDPNYPLIAMIADQLQKDALPDPHDERDTSASWLRERMTKAAEALLALVQVPNG